MTLSYRRIGNFAVLGFVSLMAIGALDVSAQSTVYIECADGSGKTSRGSGVLVGNRGEVLTARHVVQDSTYTCRGLIGTVAETPTRRLHRRKVSAFYDAALMFFVPENNENFATVTYVPLSEDSRGQHILVHGFPASNPTGQLSSRSGVISTTIAAEDGTIQTDALTTEGMSGGPVFVKGSPELVGIIAGAQFSRTTGVPQHFAVLAAEMFAIEFGLQRSPRVQVATIPTPPKRVDTLFVSGSAVTEVAGTGGGGLSSRRKVAVGLGETSRATGRGGERSECDEASGRTVSVGDATGRVDVIGGSSLILIYDVLAQGGHYRTAAGCLGSNLVGITGHDTGSNSRVELLGKIEFTQAGTDPLKVEWTDMPKGARLSVNDADLSALVKGIEFEGTGSKMLANLQAGKRYEISISLIVTADHVGSYAPDWKRGTAFLRLNGGVFDRHASKQGGLKPELQHP